MSARPTPARRAAPLRRIGAARPRRRAPVVVAPLDAVGAAARAVGVAGQRPPGEVYIAADALACLGERVGEAPRADAARDLDRVVHRILAVGLAASSLLMLAGLALGAGLHRGMPAAMPAAGAILGRIAALRPSGFLALGLLVLIATPILRVVGSIAAFVAERDWRYATITTAVLLVLLASLLLGKGA